MLRRLTAAVFVGSLTLIGCKGTTSREDDTAHGGQADASVGRDAGASTVSTAAEPGFVTLEPRHIRISGDVIYEGTTAEARLFYAFYPAEHRPEEMPLLVVFNGGPSVATSSNLAILGAGPMYLDYFGDGALKPNPHSFTSLGNVLFIDTRHVGFSYGVLDPPSNETAREASYNFINLSLFTDAGDLLLVVLDTLSRHRELKENPVVLVGESYGGARAAMISRYLSRPAALSDGTGMVTDITLDS